VKNLIFDTGALLAGDRDDPVMKAIVTAARDANATIFVPAACIAEAWRNGSRQANLARLLKTANDRPALDENAAKRAGEMLARISGGVHVVDASVVDVALQNEPAAIITSDPNDIHALLAAQPRHRVVVRPI